MSELKRTPLYDFHVARGGRLVDFAGWEMPVQYRSILEEHKAVRQAAGIFDVSHMGEADVSGPGAAAFLNHLVTNDVAKLFPGRTLYSPMCDPQGGAVDDLLVYMRGPEDFFLCLNAGNTAKDVAWMRECAIPFEVEITDRSADYALIAIQGPRASAIVQTLTGANLAAVKYYHFTQAEVAGVDCLVSRTGYTGEDGFELYHSAREAVRLAEALSLAGQSHGLVWCGLGARDSLRLEAGYPLYGHELSRKISPIAAGLAWTVKFEKGADFVGQAALEAEKKNGSTQRVVFFRTGDRRIVRPESVVFGSDGVAAGHVLSGTISPMLNVAIGSALVAAEAAQGPLAADIRGAKVDLHLVKPPFVELRKPVLT